MKTLLYSFSLFLLFSCDSMVPTQATEEQKKLAINKASFDPMIVSGISRYDDLKNFLLRYGDTIISYRNKRNYIIEVHGNGKMDTVLQKQDCYVFFQHNSHYDITNVPDFIKPKLDSIFRSIGENNINSFEVCKNKAVTIQIRSEDGENGLYISHSLMWNTPIERDYAYIENKDTSINENCIYRIGMTEHHGH